MLTPVAGLDLKHGPGRAAHGRYRFAPRPSLAERVFALVGIFLFTAGLPVDWFVVLTLANNAQGRAESTGPLASLVYGGIAGVALMVVLPRIEMLFHMIERNKVLVAIHAWAVTSVLWSVDPGTTFRRSVALGATLLFGMYIAMRFERHEILRMATGAAAVTAILHLIWVVALPRYGVSAVNDNWDGIQGNKNGLGQFSVYAGMLLTLEIARGRWSRTWTVPTLFVCFALLLGSQSKTAFASCALLICMLVVFQIFRARSTLFGAVVISMLLATILATLFTIAALPFIADSLGKDITLTGRTPLWGELWAVVFERPIVGHGYEAFWGGWRSPANELWLKFYWHPQHAHNAAFQHVLDLGVVGLGLILTFFLRAVATATRLIRRTPGAPSTVPIALLSYMLLFSITETGIIGRSAPWLMICAFMAGANCEQAVTKSAVHTSPLPRTVVPE